jgi:hypothetical protein
LVSQLKSPFKKKIVFGTLFWFFNLDFIIIILLLLFFLFSPTTHVVHPFIYLFIYYYFFFPHHPRTPPHPPLSFLFLSALYLQYPHLCAAPGAKLCMISDLLGDSGSVTG